MRLLATFCSTGLAAVMFEADGTGSVQYPNGNLWMSFTAESGKGALYSHSGEVTRAWSSADEKPVELLLDQHLVSQLSWISHALEMIHSLWNSCLLELNLMSRPC